MWGVVFPKQALRGRRFLLAPGKRAMQSSGSPRRAAAVLVAVVGILEPVGVVWGAAWRMLWRLGGWREKKM